MNLSPTCYPCIMNMVLSISSLSGFDPVKTGLLMDDTLHLLLELGKSAPVPPPVAAKRLFQRAAELSGAPEAYDPYKPLKKKANDTVMAIYGQLERMIAEADSPVESAIRLSALGNILDFAIIDPSKIDIQKEVAAAADLIFERYDDGPFFSILSRARQVLILGDNAGEIVFDKLLAKTLKAFKPGLTVTYAVRHRPVLNDITLEEARDIGMDEVAEVISSGSLAPGTCLDETTSEFNALFESAGLVIAKGQGNYETLNAAPRENLFFIFRVKCKQVAETMNAPLHSLVLLKS